MKPETWRALRNCRDVDPAIFYPAKVKDLVEPKRYCASCPVKNECLEDALTTGEAYGVRGGLSEQERRALRKARRAA